MGSKIKSGNVSFDLKRFAGIKRDYSKEEVEKLKGTLILNILFPNLNQKNFGIY